MNRPELSLASLLLVAAVACAKKPEPPRRTEPWLASASASGAAAPAPSAPLGYRFAPESSVRFSLPARKAKLSGVVPLGGGTLQLDARRLEDSKASLDADLTRLSLDSDSLPSDSGYGGAPNAAALQWLELGPGVAPERRAAFSTARFELAALERLSSSALDLRAARPVSVRAVAIGTLLIHGFRAPVRVNVVLKTLPPDGAGLPRLSIRSVSPLVLPLAPHDIVARDASGVADPAETARVSDLVGKQAHIELDLLATPEPAGTK